jgi:hypothetical protein
MTLHECDDIFRLWVLDCGDASPLSKRGHVRALHISQIPLSRRPDIAARCPCQGGKEDVKRENEEVRLARIRLRQGYYGTSSRPTSEEEDEDEDDFEDEWTLDEVREEILKRSYARALVIGDFESGRRTIAQEMNVNKLALDREKLEEWKKEDQAKALQYCVIESREFPEAHQQFMSAFATLRQAKQARREAADATRQKEQQKA